MLTDLTGFQRDLLSVIAAADEDENLTGLKIKERAEADFTEKEIHHGRLYPNLDTLIDRGYITKTRHDRRTNVYELTDRGRREIRARIKWEVTRYDFLLD